MTPTERRRSSRVMLTIPLRVQGLDAKGQAFESEARAVTLNRYGARIQISRPLCSGQTVRVVNPLIHHEADLRVVDSLSPHTEEGGDWGVECIDAEENIWGIQFPAATEGEASDAKALLECRKCHVIALQPLSLLEVDTLRTVGILAKPCQKCNAVSPWGYAEMQTKVNGPADAEQTSTEAPTQAGTTPAYSQQRRHRRVCMQLPVAVRDDSGGPEVTKTENLSRGGFCFASGKDYQVGEEVRVVLPYDITRQDIEVPAQIVREEQIEGSSRKIYGADFTRRAN